MEKKTITIQTRFHNVRFSESRGWTSLSFDLPAELADQISDYLKSQDKSPIRIESQVIDDDTFFSQDISVGHEYSAINL